MMNRPSRFHSRRAVLRGGVFIGISLPWLEVMAKPRRFVRKDPQRFIFVFSANGHVMGEYMPKGEGTDFQLSKVLAPLTDYKSRLTVITGLNNQSAIDDNGNPHSRAAPHLLTGVKMIPDKTIPTGGTTGWGGGISLDQELAKSIGTNSVVRSLHLGVRSNDVVNKAVPRNRFSYTGAEQPITPEVDPRKAFERLVASVPDGGGETPELAKVRAQRRSVLDFVGDDFSALHDAVGTADQHKIDAHLTAIRELELSLESPPKAGECELPNWNDWLTENELKQNENVPKITKQHLDIMALAMRCDLTRVGTFQWKGTQSPIKYVWLGNNQKDNHHSASHERQDPGDQARDALIDIGTWHAEQLAYLASQLDAFGEEDGTVLDNTAVLWASEISEGAQHSFKNIPFLYIGGAGKALATGRHVSFGGRPHNDLLVTLCKAYGLSKDKWGADKHNKGVLTELLA